MLETDPTHYYREKINHVEQDIKHSRRALRWDRNIILGSLGVGLMNAVGSYFIPTQEIGINIISFGVIVSGIGAHLTSSGHILDINNLSIQKESFQQLLDEIRRTSKNTLH